MISIHVPAWGTTVAITRILFGYRFQSTFPRGERHPERAENAKAWYISIHVPAWGTTACFSSARLTTVISIHVPAWGTTYTDSVLH